MLKRINSKYERMQRKNDCIKRIMKETGWNYFHTFSALRETSMRLGISNKEYEMYRLFELPLDEQKLKYEEIKEAERKKEERIHEQKIRQIAKKAGWKYEEAEQRFYDAQKRTGCNYKEFTLYKFDQIDETLQSELFLMDLSSQISQKYNVNRKQVNALCNKEVTNTIFSKYLKRPWCVNTKISCKEFCEKFEKAERIIYKPLSGHRGQGIEAYNVNIDNIKNVYHELTKLPEGVVEQYVVQHSKMAELSPSSVNTVRIVTVSSNTQKVTKDGNKADIAYASLRIGGGTSIVDNFHSGGMVAAINLESGKLDTDAADMEGNVFEKHPVTGKIIRGFEIPYLKEAMEMIYSAISENKLEGYLGWDIAIREDGPVLIEINTMPGVVLLTMPYLAEKKGMKHVMQKYMDI